MIPHLLNISQQQKMNVMLPRGKRKLVAVRVCIAFGIVVLCWWQKQGTSAGRLGETMLQFLSWGRDYGSSCSVLERPQTSQAERYRQIEKHNGRSCENCTEPGLAPAAVLRNRSNRNCDIGLKHNVFHCVFCVLSGIVPVGEPTP